MPSNLNNLLNKLNIPVRAKKWPLSKKERLGYDGFVHNNIKGGALIMKFKQINGQNQRIERISQTQLVVGIDIAKETHVAQATNFRGIVLAKRYLTFKNAIEGYEKLQRWMDELQRKHQLKTVIIGMEPTGHIGGTWRIGLQTKALTSSW